MNPALSKILKLKIRVLIVITSARFSLTCSEKYLMYYTIFFPRFAYWFIISTGSYFVHLLLIKFSFPSVTENSNTYFKVTR